MTDQQSAQNVILITVDSLRADFMRLYGGPCPTPNIESFAAESVIYKNAFSTGGHTKHSFPGILASNYPTSGGVNSFGQRTSVAYYFHRAGFQTAGFHSNPLLARSKGYAQGFQTFWDSLDQEKGTESPEKLSKKKKMAKTISMFLIKSIWRFSPRLYHLLQNRYHKLLRMTMNIEFPYELGELTNQRVFNWLKQQKQCFFLWVHYMDVHQPWAVSQKISSPKQRQQAWTLAQKALRTPEKLSQTDIDLLKELYGKEIAYIDKCVGQLFKLLKKSGRWEQTVVAFASDHGEGFMEHGIFFHGNSLYNELLHVPLIIKDGRWGPETIEEPVSLIDLAPTLVESAGIEIPSTFEGQPFGPNPKSTEIIAENAHRVLKTDKPELAMIHQDQWKLIINFVTKKEELYETTSDPNEKLNIAAEQKEIVERLRNRLTEHIGRKRPNVKPSDEVATVQLQPDTNAETERIRRRLSALGYFDE